MPCTNSSKRSWLSSTQCSWPIRPSRSKRWSKLEDRRNANSKWHAPIRAAAIRTMMRMAISCPVQHSRGWPMGRRMQTLPCIPLILIRTRLTTNHRTANPPRWIEHWMRWHLDKLPYVDTESSARVATAALVIQAVAIEMGRWSMERSHASLARPAFVPTAALVTPQDARLPHRPRDTSRIASPSSMSLLTALAWSASFLRRIDFATFVDSPSSMHRRRSLLVHPLCRRWTYTAAHWHPCCIIRVREQTARMKACGWRR